MSVPTPFQPTTAERVRSACAGAAGAMLAVDGVSPTPTPVHHLLPDGSFAVTVAGGSAVAAAVPARTGIAGVAAVLEVTDYAPLPLREPVRSLIWVHGRLRRPPEPAVRELLDAIATEHPNPALLEVGNADVLLLLEAESVVVADAGGAEPVDVGDLLAAGPDPFCAFEAAWLRHLDADHPEVLARLAGRLPATMRRGQVRPLGLDRYGLRLRIENTDGDHDVRLPFATPVHDVSGLSRAIRVLMGCPFVNGLRARRA
jgi:hypothetical protein